MTRTARPAGQTAARAVLSRTTFATSREMDFFSEKELTTQTGHEVREWPLVFLKEGIDYALDACDEADVPPVVEIAADAGGITIRDNGPGLPEATLRAAMDFAVRASSREAYVAPDRGAQGNALKTLLAMPAVIDPEHGRFIVAAHGRRHVISCGADPITQRAVINDDAADLPKVQTGDFDRGRECKVSGRATPGKVQSGDHDTPQNARLGGTELRIEWRERQSDANGDAEWPFRRLRPNSPSSPFAGQFRRMVEGFATFNPHATFRLSWFGDRIAFPATDPAWRKWKPSRPTSSHWYERPHFERLIAAYLTHDRDAGTDRLVSELLAEFDGLSRSAARSKVLAACGLKRANLGELVAGDKLDSPAIARLLAAMKSQTRPVKAKALGVLGEDHLRRRLLAMGALPETFRYARKLADAALPGVLECAFGYRGDVADDARKIITGANWSAAIKNPFRAFDASGRGLESLLAELRAGAAEPIVLVLHLAHPRVEYADRGKTSIILSDNRDGGTP